MKIAPLRLRFDRLDVTLRDESTRDDFALAVLSMSSVHVFEDEIADDVGDDHAADTRSYVKRSIGTEPHRQACVLTNGQE